ncbi:MAG: Smr/MutS family protein [Paracoccaceae bacterium]|nr:MAG: Smr/MutS family protein [Paracoccaceae bacterium]
MARRRTLRPDEHEVWQAVARTARPLKSRDLPTEMAPALPTPPSPSSPERPAPLPAFNLGERAAGSRGHDILPSLSERLAVAPLRMDAKAYARMTRGRIAPEARIDLHGMTLAEAHPELIRFVLNAHAEGLRLVLVITGKGKPGADDGPIPRRPGVLRHQVPQWLRLPPLGPAVQQVAEAHLRHGGSGAYYVYLRRRG